MRVSLGNALVKEGSGDIRNQVRSLLVAAGVGNRLPTPKDDVVQCARLVQVGQLDLSDYEESWIEKGITFFKDMLSKVKGLIDFRERIIYVNPEIHLAQQTFVTYHEVTHKILPWHEGLYNPHLDDEYSIDPRIASGLEQEANIGASLIQFQIDRFARDLRDLSLGLASAKHLADLYGTSLHSSFRKYVEDNNRACALLVLKESKMASADNEPILRLWYPLQSQKFTAEFGLIDWEKFYCKGNLIYDIAFADTSEIIKEADQKLRDLQGSERICRIEVFHNTFNYFVFIYPIPGSPLRTKLVIVHTNKTP